MINIVQTITAYNLWANAKIANALLENESALDVAINSSFPTMRKTVYHIWGCEELWWKRMHGESHDHIPNIDFRGGFDEASEKWLACSGNFSSLAKQQDEYYLSSSCRYKDTRGNSYTHQRWQMIYHCMNHGTFHRGQVVTMMRVAGMTAIPQTDLIVFIRDSVK